MDEFVIVFLLTIRDFDFTCADLKPNKTPRAEWNNLDLTFGDRAYQEFVFEAKPRDGMPMTILQVPWGSACGSGTILAAVCLWAKHREWLRTQDWLGARK
ncbi:hypothetical protein J4E86_004959 [Alternaria arbusti]|uniref:uncharacterized protein n=1 Tax=Alternaria arbusti TaxID=232088 RepID=UPI00221E56CA|nr:uncharacterized protein J4E86_004959 [Alternaria arbusti]KAI4957820.1 hypothetical protein J4E86_004959 [Alternaria arbusti]